MTISEAEEYISEDFEEEYILEEERGSQSH